MTRTPDLLITKYARTGDGILTSLKLMEDILAKKLSLSRLAEPVTTYPQGFINVRMKDKKPTQEDPAVQASMTEESGDSGRLIVRESGTEPLAWVIVEAKGHDRCQKLVERVVNVILAQGYGTEG